MSSTAIFHYSIFPLQCGISGTQLLGILKHVHCVIAILHQGSKILSACSIKMQACPKGILTTHKIELRHYASVNYRAALNTKL